MESELKPRHSNWCLTCYAKCLLPRTLWLPLGFQGNELFLNFHTSTQSYFGTKNNIAAEIKLLNYNQERETLHTGHPTVLAIGIIAQAAANAQLKVASSGFMDHSGYETRMRPGQQKERSWSRCLCLASLSRQGSLSLGRKDASSHYTLGVIPV